MATEHAAPSGLPAGRFSGHGAFAQLVRDALAQAALDGWREIVLCDASFEDWPLRERSLVESLHAWSGAGRRFTMLAASYDVVLRQHARFVTWRRTWGHIIDCRICHHAGGPDFPSVLWSPVWAMSRLDPVRCTGISGAEPERRVRLRETLDELRRNSSPGFPASTLGL